MNPSTQSGIEQDPSPTTGHDTQLPPRRREPPPRRRRRRGSARPARAALLPPPSSSPPHPPRPTPLPSSRSSPSPTTLPSSQPAVPKIGQDQRPGTAAEGTVLDSIETAVARRMRSDPSAALEDIYKLVKDFAVVRTEGRDICTFYLDRCMRHCRLSHDRPPSRQSTAPSISQSDGRSLVLSKHGSSATPPTSTGGRQPSTLALDDLTSTIAIILPNDVSKAVTWAKRDGRKSYISPSIIERHNLNVNAHSRNVLIELRRRVVDNDRGRSFRVRNCSFRVREGLETDLALGSEVQGQLRNHASVEGSSDTESSSEDEAPQNSRPKPIPQDAEISSYAESNVLSPSGSPTAKDYLDALLRILDMDLGPRGAGNISAYGVRLDHRNDPRSPSPERPGRTVHRRRRDCGNEAGQLARPQAHRPRHN
ncbi:hypothetical protein F5Y16DRAFT_392610 [Xylariaceae sp. FL0255]|nr:hypothetical protein F5Y16DRAFT_392610 [Xylariaceae sp. FL0255]